MRGEPGGDPEAAVGQRPGVQRTVDQPDPLTHTDQAMAGAGGLQRRGGRGRRGVDDQYGQPCAVRGHGHRHPGPRPRGMPHHIGKRLLNDPVRRQIHRRFERHRLLRQRQLDRHTRPYGPLDQLRQHADPGLRGLLRAAVLLGLLAAQHPEQPAHLRQRLPGGRRDRPELVLGLLGNPAEAIGRTGRLNRDHRHVVGDDIMQFTGDAGALLQQRPMGPLGLADGLLLDQLALGVAAFAQGGTHHQHHASEDEQQHPGAVAAVGGEHPGEQPGHTGRQPDGGQGATSLAQRQRQHQREIADDRHRRPRPGAARDTVGADERHGTEDIRGEDHPPGLQRPGHREQQRHGLRGGERTGQRAGQAVVVAEDVDGRRQQGHREPERDNIGQAAQPAAPDGAQQRGAGLGRGAELHGQHPQRLPYGAQRPLTARLTHGAVGRPEFGAGRSLTHRPSI